MMNRQDVTRRLKRSVRHFFDDIAHDVQNSTTPSQADRIREAYQHALNDLEEASQGARERAAKMKAAAQESAGDLLDEATAAAKERAVHVQEAVGERWDDASKYAKKRGKKFRAKAEKTASRWADEAAAVAKSQAQQFRNSAEEQAARVAEEAGVIAKQQADKLKATAAATAADLSVEARKRAKKEEKRLRKQAKKAKLAAGTRLGTMAVAAGLMSRRNPWKGFILGALGGLIGLMAMEWYWKFVVFLTGEDPRQAANEESSTQVESEAGMLDDISLLGKNYEEGESARVAAGRNLYEIVVGESPSDETKELLSNQLHYAVCMGAAGIYGVMQDKSSLIDVTGGTLLGTGLWFLGAEVAVPLLGLSEGPTATPSEMHAHSWGAHIAYGVGAAVGTQLLYRLVK